MNAKSLPLHQTVLPLIRGVMRAANGLVNEYERKICEEAKKQSVSPGTAIEMKQSTFEFHQALLPYLRGIVSSYERWINSHHAQH